MLIGICWFWSSSFLAKMKQFDNFLGGGSNYFSHSNYIISMLSIFSQIKPFLCRKFWQQISKNFIINLYIAQFDLKLLVFVFSNFFEQVLKDESHDTRIPLLAKHCVSLASSCCSISKYGRVKTLHCAFNKKLCCIVIYFLLSRVLIKYIIKRVLLFLMSFLASRDQI